MITDELIKEKLSRKEARELFHISKTTGIPGIHFLMRGDWPEKYFSDLKEDLKTYPKGAIGRDRAEKTVRCYELYSKVCNDPREIMIHWNIAWETQKEMKRSYKSMSKPPRQDNKSYINYGSGNSHSGKIRYPRKVRKTAWKRFYKLFPHLKPEES